MNWNYIDETVVLGWWDGSSWTKQGDQTVVLAVSSNSSLHGKLGS